MRTGGLKVILLLLATALVPLHAAQAPISKPEIRVGIVLFEQVQIIDFTGPYEVFGAAGFGVTTLTADGKPVTTEMGLKVTPDAGFADAPRFDVLLVPGGTVRDAKKDARILDFIRSQSQQAKHVLSVCTGAEILANTGLLDGRKATTFMGALDRLATNHPKIEVVDDQRWVDTGQLITSAGLSSGIDAALHVVSRLRGEAKARSVALHLEYDWEPDHGFVRGRMADRILPQLRGVKWPKDMVYESLYSLGDEQQWSQRGRIRSATPASEFLQLIEAEMRTEGDWRADAASEGLAWRHVSSQTPARFHITTHAGANAQEFEVAMELQRGAAVAK